MLTKYANLYKRGATESAIRHLCVKLAKEAVFGEDIMRRCTPGGTRELPGLPYDELFALKKAIFAQCPQFWGVPEDLWKKCRDSIEQACKRLRRKVSH